MHDARRPVVRRRQNPERRPRLSGVDRLALPPPETGLITYGAHMLKFRNSKFEFEIELPFPQLPSAAAVLLLTATTSCAMADQQRAATGRLTELVNEAWEFELQEDPLFATSVGDHRF